ncbi:MAG: P1 family peptidase [Rhodobacteraceae bacterium]|nr:P1 family peptidase [Paracoccaceae bacterium]
MSEPPKNLITDVPGILVGNAQDAKLKSGVTVVTSDTPMTAAVHVMGGAPGTRETDLLAPENLVDRVDALVLSGGSAFGLDAASGVMQALREAGRGYAVETEVVPIVPAAILMDLLNGGNKTWDSSPYPALGRAAFDVAAPEFALGTVGAGTGAIAGALKGGLGSASYTLEGGGTVGAVIAVNSLGQVTVGDTRNFWAAPWEVADEFGGIGPAAASVPPTLPPTKLAPGANTTIGIVATDVALDKAALKRLAIAAHDGMARSIYPSHTPYDGDLIFAVSTGRREMRDPVLTPMELGHAAAHCVTRAIARAVYDARPAEGDIVPTWSEKFT